MRYSIKPRDRTYAKGYGFLLISKNIGKNLSIKFSKKLFNSAKKSTAYVIKTASKRATELKQADATGDITGNIIPDKITSVSKKSSDNILDQTEISKKDIYLQKRQQIIDELSLEQRIGLK